MNLTPEQYATLTKPINPIRIAQRSQGGKTLSYLESWEVRAHLIRIFGYTNFDVELLDYHHVTTREYQSSGGTPKPMVEVVYAAKVRLTIRAADGYSLLAVYTEGACGSASGGVNMLGDHHDNALKSAESDALKRCAINLGNQFGLSLYDDGSTRDVVKGTLVKPEVETMEVTDGEGHTIAQVPVNGDLTDEQREALADTLGAQLLGEEPTRARVPRPGETPGEGGRGERDSVPPPVAPGDATQDEHLGEVLADKVKS